MEDASPTAVKSQFFAAVKALGPPSPLILGLLSEVKDLHRLFFSSRKLLQTAVTEDRGPLKSRDDIAELLRDSVIQ